MQLGKRIQKYEQVFRQFLPPRMPAIIRVDGRAFHTLLRGCEKPFDDDFAVSMDKTAKDLLSEIQTARMAYVQSDEISLLLIDYNKFDSEQWFGGNINKIVSVSAAIATASFNNNYNNIIGASFDCNAMFDSRVFTIPERDVSNYFVQRQQDATRNSIQMVAQSHYSHKELHKKNTKQLLEMCWDVNDGWGTYSPYWKRGRVIYKNGSCDYGIPIFSKKLDYLENFLIIDEE